MRGKKKMKENWFYCRKSVQGKLWAVLSLNCTFNSGWGSDLVGRVVQRLILCYQKGWENWQKWTQKVQEGKKVYICIRISSQWVWQHYFRQLGKRRFLTIIEYNYMHNYTVTHKCNTSVEPCFENSNITISNMSWHTSYALISHQHRYCSVIYQGIVTISSNDHDQNVVKTLYTVKVWWHKLSFVNAGTWKIIR